MTISRRHKAGFFAIFYGIPLLLFIILFSSLCFGEDNAEIKDFRFWDSKEYVRFVFDLSKPVEFTSGKLSNPERLFFDLKNTKVAASLRKNVPVGHDLVKAVRLGQYNTDTARIVFDLQAEYYNFKVMNLEDPPRIVIDIYSGGKKGIVKEDLRAKLQTDALRPDEKSLPEDKPADVEHPESGKPPDLRSKPADLRNRIIKRTVVLDAGHGGHDPGAVGPSGLCEKNVVLDVALRVRDIIRKDYPFYEVILTRDRDVFVPLPDRAKIANNKNADLFISIHANASPNRNARGIETYLLNWTNDIEAMKVAARENAISLKQMKQQMNGELGMIFASLDRERNRDQAINVAGYIQQSLISSIGRKYADVSDHGVKQALFYVLVGAKMPSSLIEISFISNPREEKLLATESYRQSLARSIAEGIHKYFTSQPPQHIAFGEQEKGRGRMRAEAVNYTRAKER
ncbi:MAG TPA: N-acetylmuramoyl-L-alanine amidase [Dissulfurispiraceae bacterium]|nr:N-acetylmuramoyl-L-alanine amidase [Dissulfurispiraceae bacterium]